MSPMLSQNLSDFNLLKTHFNRLKQRVQAVRGFK